jgi:hypothetical protein
LWRRGNGVGAALQPHTLIAPANGSSVMERHTASEAVLREIAFHSSLRDMGRGCQSLVSPNTAMARGLDLSGSNQGRSASGCRSGLHFLHGPWALTCAALRRLLAGLRNACIGEQPGRKMDYSFHPGALLRYSMYFRYFKLPQGGYGKRLDLLGRLAADLQRVVPMPCGRVIGRQPPHIHQAPSADTPGAVGCACLAAAGPSREGSQDQQRCHAADLASWRLSRVVLAWVGQRDSYTRYMNHCIGHAPSSRLPLSPYSHLHCLPAYSRTEYRFWHSILSLPA